MFWLFSSVEWWKLLPAPELLVEQPGASDPRRFVVQRQKRKMWGTARRARIDA